MSEGDGIPGLAEKLDHLFLTVPAPTKRGRYSNETAARALGERGVEVSSVNLSHLRSGRRTNPGARLLAALADLFGVPYGYFFDPATEEAINADLTALAGIRDPRIRRLTELSHGLSPQSLDYLDGLLVRMRQVEGLPADPD